MTITVFQARRIITMRPARPSATHVAVRDGRILAAGSLAEVSCWGPFELETRFARKLLMPGLVEGHSHLMAGTLWRDVYCGYFDGTTHLLMSPLEFMQRLAAPVPKPRLHLIRLVSA